MILELFAFIVALALFFVWLGFYGKRKLFSIIGLSIFFILSSWIILYSSASWLLPNVPVNSSLKGLEFRTGSFESYSYMCSICGSPSVNVSSCIGTPTPCIEHNSLGICSLYSGCSWDIQGAECVGTPSNCTSHQSQELCQFNGCTFNTSVIVGTPSVNASVVASKTITDTYTVYNDVSTFWVGLLFEILSLFGLVIVWGLDE